jgi:hypothetical protein
MLSLQNISNGQPILSDINNGTLVGVNAMPMKDLTSTNESSFESDRKEFNKTNIVGRGNPLRNPNFGASGTSRILPTIFDGTHTAIQKKWIGGNRDASQIVNNRRVRAAGASVNLSGSAISFVNNFDVNTIRDARHRTRSGGAIAPAKKTHNYVGAPVFY